MIEGKTVVVAVALYRFQENPVRFKALDSSSVGENGGP